MLQRTISAHHKRKPQRRDRRVQEDRASTRTHALLGIVPEATPTFVDGEVSSRNSIRRDLVAAAATKTHPGCNTVTLQTTNRDARSPWVGALPLLTGDRACHGGAAMQLALFQGAPTPARHTRGRGRASARRRPPAQHEVRPLPQPPVRATAEPVASEPGLSFARPVSEPAAAPTPASAATVAIERPTTPSECPPSARECPPVPVEDLAAPLAALAVEDHAGVEFDPHVDADLEVEVELEAEPEPAADRDAVAPFSKEHPTRGKKLAPEVLTAAEVRALIGACSKRAITGIRNKALLAVLWRTGLRISEGLDLMPHDVDYERGTVRVRFGKGLKSRTVVFNDLDCVPLLEDWLRLRAELDGVGQGAPLFCTLVGTHVETSYIRHLMPRLARRCGLARRIHAHALRHTHAADLAIAGVPVLAIQQQLGHASLSTTSDYLRRVGVPLRMVGAVRPTGGDGRTACW